jgi:hypothetical protein
MPTVHKTANITTNHADPGEITVELHEFIDSITQMEEMLCSLASPCFIMRVSKIGQYFHFRSHGLLMLSLTPTTQIPGSREHFSPTPGI